ncbi:hypothetical protein DICVIV_12516 [Dictyocaulus viviparus]|uniref:Tetratricopeptide repeat protein n=1 Tax=Dictyocaulus viviparus TaxID=29172 RepID=A0A0D8XAA9_DICVI|nr:hypothetical protein DICVIV_12516 [Dictyocaulus viviparus]
MTSSSNLCRYIGVIAALGVSVAGLYYIVWRKKNTRRDGATIKELKELGNKLFAAKKYGDSIRIFSKAITACNTEDCRLLKAMCFQNRAAAKEHHGGYSVDDMLSDCQQALKYNPRYAKAYFRKARLLNMGKDYMKSLICVFCAIQLDPALEIQATSILSTLLEKLEKQSYESWLHNTTTRGSAKHVRHEKVYIWLHKTVVSDCIRRDVISQPFLGCSPYGDAIKKVRSKEYDEVADVAMQEYGENLLNALLLAGRFYLYQNRLELLSYCLQKFDLIFNALSEEKKIEKQELLNAKHVLCIEAGRSYAEIKNAFANAMEYADRTNADFYVMAAFRYVVCNEAQAAMDVLSTKGICTDNMKLLQLTLQIYNNAFIDDNNLDMALLHNSILQLENFVAKLEPKTGYALSVLAKVTATFSNGASARLISEDILRLEPAESFHYFDRSCMAASSKDAMDYLEKCIEIEPYHAEANFMYASLMMNEIGTRIITPDEYDKIEKHISIAMSTFDDNIDFPVIMGVFRLHELLLAKKEASNILL